MPPACDGGKKDRVRFLFCLKQCVQSRSKYKTITSAEGAFLPLEITPKKMPCTTFVYPLRAKTALKPGRAEWGKGPGRRKVSTMPRAPKSQQCRKCCFQQSTFASERPQFWTWRRQTCFLHRTPSNLATPLDRLSQKLPILLIWRCAARGFAPARPWLTKHQQRHEHVSDRPWQAPEKPGPGTLPQFPSLAADLAQPLLLRRRPPAWRLLSQRSARRIRSMLDAALVANVLRHLKKHTVNAQPQNAAWMKVHGAMDFFPFV